jgi:predicted cobalt transporter CbtA
MIRTLVVRGLLAGLIAGLLAGCFASVFGEPRVDAAIAYEEAAAPAEHHHASASEAPHSHAQDAGPVSRDGQRGGLFLATALSGIAMGVLFALLFAAVRGRAGPRDPWRLALALGGLVVVAVVLVPLVKYPPNPPAVGDPETIGRRTVLYLALLGCAVLSVLAAVRAAGAVRTEAPAWARPLAGVGTFVVTAGAAMLLLPGVHEVPADFPAALLWEFRLASAGTQLVLWLSLATLFGIATADRRTAP